MLCALIYDGNADGERAWRSLRGGNWKLITVMIKINERGRTKEDQGGRNEMSGVIEPFQMTRSCHFLPERFWPTFNIERTAQVISHAYHCMTLHD